MNEVKLYENEEFGMVRMVVIDEEPWFVGRDVARALGYGDGNANSKSLTNALTDHVAEDDRRHVSYKEFMEYRNGDSENINHNGITIVNESGVYALIFGSQLPSAKKFKHWVTSEVLPSVRKNGGYIAGQEAMSDDDLLEKALLVAQRRIDEKNAIIRNQQKEIIEKDQIIAVNKDKVEYFDAVLDSRLLTNFRDAAKILGMSQTQFTGYLMNKGYIYMTNKREIRPTEPYRKSDLFKMKPYINRRSGFSGVQTYVTQKGVQYFKTMFDMNDIMPDALPKHGGRDAGKRNSTKEDNFS